MEPGHWRLHGTHVQPICEGRRSGWRRPLGLSSPMIPCRIHSRVTSYLACGGRKGKCYANCILKAAATGSVQSRHPCPASLLLRVMLCVLRALTSPRGVVLAGSSVCSPCPGAPGGREPVCASRSPMRCPSSWAWTESSELLLAGGTRHNQNINRPVFLSNVPEATCAVHGAQGRAWC